MEQRLIDANAIITFVSAGHLRNPMEKTWSDNDVVDMIESRPTVDAVPVGAVEQIRWERDIAMKQLEEHGIPFGGKADDVVKVCRCKDCQWFDANDDYYDSYCDKNGISVEEDFYCADGERRTE